MKYFVIGYNKTATTTFHQLFLKNTISSQHTEQPWDTDNFNAFSDGGNSQNYRILDQKYPNSVFILNIRRLDNWLLSRFKHGISTQEKPNWAYPPTQKLCTDWILERETYYEGILDYFKERPNKLMIVNIDKTNWIPFVCRQFGFRNNVPFAANKRLTTSSPQHKGSISIINRTFKDLQYSDTASRSNILFKDPVKTAYYLSIFKNNIL